MDVHASYQAPDIALRVALCSQRLMACDDVVSLSELTEDTYPHKRVFAPRQQPITVNKTPRSPLAELKAACNALFYRTEGIISYVVGEHGKALASESFLRCWPPLEI